MKLSVVATMYYSAPYVAEFCARICDAVSQITQNYEIILVNDGSPDDALAKALAAKADHPQLKVVDLSRNFGHHAAILQGLTQATGDYIFLIDIDLEEPPEIFSQFWQTMAKDSDIDVVGGVQQTRKGRASERVLGDLSWKLFQRLSNVRLQANLITARLMTRRYVDALLSYPEREIFLAAICADVGFRQVFVPVAKTDSSATTYSFSRKLKLFANGLTAFSVAPLLVSVAIAGALMLLTVALGLYALIAGLLGYSMTGWASITFLVTFATTIIVFIQGMSALYIAQIFKEVKKRPLTVVKAIHD